MNIYRFFTVCILALLVSSCASSSSNPELTPLELQSLQSQEFETSKDIAFGSVVSVFQDLGYIIQGADLDTGFITAESGSESKHDWIFTGSKYDTKTKATAFVEQIAEKRTNIRLNFVTGTKESSIWGQTSTKDMPIIDSKVYERAFARIGDAIFVRSGVAEETPESTVDGKANESSGEAGAESVSSGTSKEAEKPSGDETTGETQNTEAPEESAGVSSQ